MCLCVYASLCVRVCDKVTYRLILQMDYICASQPGWYTAALRVKSGIIATTTTTATTIIKPKAVKAINIINTADTASGLKKKFNSNLAGNVRALNCF